MHDNRWRHQATARSLVGNGTQSPLGENVRPPAPDHNLDKQLDSVSSSNGDDPAFNLQRQSGNLSLSWQLATSRCIPVAAFVE